MFTLSSRRPLIDDDIEVNSVWTLGMIDDLSRGRDIIDFTREDAIAAGGRHCRGESRRAQL
jgi:hypothetical protein